VSRRNFYGLAFKAKGNLKEYLRLVRDFFKNQQDGRKKQIKHQTRENYSVTRRSGPMFYLAHVIVKKMADSGYPTKIVYCYRSPEEQARLYAQGRSTEGVIVTKAKPWQSAHQYWEAADFCHKTLGWNVPMEYWDQLERVVKAVEAEYRVDLTGGYEWEWDRAHVEIKHWREQKGRYLDLKGNQRSMTEVEHLQRFVEILGWQRLKPKDKSLLYQEGFVSKNLRKIKRS
jgi:hypothetical protein